MKERMRFLKKLTVFGLTICMVITPCSAVTAESFTDTWENGTDSSDDFSDGENFTENETTEDTAQNTKDSIEESDAEVKEDETEISDVPDQTEPEKNDDTLNLEEQPEEIQREESGESAEEIDEQQAPGEISDSENKPEEQKNQEEIFDDPVSAAGASETEKDVDATEIQLYALDKSYGDTISIPETMARSYKIKTTGKNPTFEIISGYTVNISSTGLVVPATHVVVYVDQNGNERRENEYDFGETLVSVQDGDNTVYYKFVVNDYARYYAEEKMDTFLRENITAEMTDYTKVETIAKWLAKNFNYSQYHSGYVGLMVDGGGDCWANTSAVNYMCKKLGLAVYTRYAANDAGAGSGHRNSMVIIDGERYLVDCGYVGNAPRHYEFSKMDYDYSYEILKDGTLRLYQYEGTDTNIIVPETIDGKKVTVIGNSTFQNCIWAENIESVTFPDSVTTIEKNVFYNCKKLKTVTIPKSVSTIGLAAFVPGLRESELTEIHVDPQNPYFSEKDGVVFSKDGEKLVVFPSGRSGDYQIPEGTVSIEDYAFYYCVNVASITVPGTVKKFGEGAFGNCSSLGKVTLNEGLEEIGEYAFQSCGKLKDIVIPASVKKVGKNGLHANSKCTIRVLSMDASWADGVFYSDVLIAGKENSTIQKYAEDNNYTFVKLGADNKIELQDEWFEPTASGYEYDGKEHEPPVKLKSTAPKIELDSEYEVSYKDNINAGTATVTITGKGIFGGTVQRKFQITPNEEAFFNCYFAENKLCYLEASFNGEKVEPEVVVEGLVAGRDYTVTYKDNDKPGEASVEINGIGNYKGSETLYFTIYRSLPKPKPVSDQTYTGEEITPDIEIPGLTAGEDYYVLYDDNDKPGKATATVYGQGYYKGSETLYFNIYGSLPEPEPVEDQIYTGKEITPEIEIWGLTAGEDYYVLYKNNKEPGEATATVYGKGYYKGSETLYFGIYGDLPNPAPIADQAYTGKEITPDIVIPGLKVNEDYYVLYEDNEKPGKATATVYGLGYYEGSVTVHFNIIKKAEKFVSNVKLSKSVYTYTGKAIKPTVAVTVNGKKLNGSSYKIYYKNNKNSGIGTVQVKGTGKYSSINKTLTFQILPGKMSLTGLKASGKTFTVSWKKNTQATGYQIQYAANSKFTLEKKSITVGRQSVTKYKVSGLKNKKTYYVRVRAYKKIGKTVLYGKWSTAKKIGL